MRQYHRARRFALHNTPDEARKIDERVGKLIAQVDPDWLASLGQECEDGDYVQISAGFTAAERASV